MPSAVYLLVLGITAQSCLAFAPLPALDFRIRLASPTLGVSRRQPSCSRRGLLGARAYVGNRLSSSVEVAVSKIFPAGAGWQTASIVAGNLNLSSSSAAFFITVGLGDFLGVFIGHTLFKLLKKTLSKDTSISMKSEVQTATLLGGAAFFSGSAWQPALNMMNAMNLNFTGAFVGVGVACTWAFFIGLRVWRRFLAPTMGAVERKNYQNLKSDVQLSIAIGSATAFFVGTDLTFGAANWLAGIVGIPETMSAFTGVCMAGISTSLGFMVAQLVMATLLLPNKCWIDPKPQFSN